MLLFIRFAVFKLWWPSADARTIRNFSGMLRFLSDIYYFIISICGLSKISRPFGVDSLTVLSPCKWLAHELPCLSGKTSAWQLEIKTLIRGVVRISVKLVVIRNQQGLVHVVP